jgi:hypothetical protein
MPSPVDKYFKQIKKDNPSYDDAQAWATAWSIYCKYKNPGSPSCHMPTDEYFKKESRLVAEFANALLVQKVASRYLRAMSLPENIESRLTRWRKKKDEILESLVEGATGIDDLLREFKGIDHEIRDRELRQLIRPDVQDADSLMKIVEDLGDLGVVV